MGNFVFFPLHEEHPLYVVHEMNQISYYSGIDVTVYLCVWELNYYWQLDFSYIHFGLEIQMN